MGREQRRDVRYRVQMPCVMLRGPKKNELTTEDVSFRGLFLRTDEPPALRQLVRVKLSLPPTNDEFTGYGMEVHVVPPGGPRVAGVGVQFYGVSGAEKNRWDAFIKYVGEKHANSAGETVSLLQAPPTEPIRRQHPRKEMALKIRLYTVNDLYDLYTRDISRGGMFITTELPLEAGDRLDVDMVHPVTGEVFKLRCEVRHRTATPTLKGVGVEFIGLDGQRRDQMFDFISSDIEVEEEEPVFVAPDDPKLL